MSLLDLLFKTADFEGKDIASLPDTVVGSAEELKARFDYIGKEMIALGRFNQLLELLAGQEGAGLLGFAATELIPDHTVQEALEDLGRQMQLLTVGQVPVGSITADRLAKGAAVGNLEDGSIQGRHLALGAALTNLEDGSITEQKLQPALIQSLKSASTLVGYANLLCSKEVQGKPGDLTIPVDLSTFLYGSTGKIIVRFAVGTDAASTLEIRHMNGISSMLDYILSGSCTKLPESGPEQSWYSQWQPKNEKLLFYEESSGIYYGIHGILKGTTGAAAPHSLGLPVLDSNQIRFPFYPGDEEQRIISVRIIVEVWL